MNINKNKNKVRIDANLKDERKVTYKRDMDESVRFIIIHCSATQPDKPYTAEQLEQDHKARGFRTTGYHFYIRTDGSSVQPRQLGEVGAHAKGLNRCSIGICYEGGLDADGKPSDTRTPEQRQELLRILTHLRELYPEAYILGHNQILPGVEKACPCFDAQYEYRMI